MSGQFKVIPKSDFGQMVGKEVRRVKEIYEAAASPADLDPCIREQVFSDLDKLAEKHERN